MYKKSPPMPANATDGVWEFVLLVNEPRDSKPVDAQDLQGR
jgi:hypothetical protein